jgi:uncharacterized protein YcbX
MLAVVALQRFPVKAMGVDPLESVIVGATGLLGDREWAVYDAEGKLATGKHSRRFRRMDPVFTAVARRLDDDTVVGLPGGATVVAGTPEADEALSAHFGEPVALRRETDVRHQDAATFSIVGTATLAELGRHEGDGRPLDPRHLRANVVVATSEPFLEETWLGRDVRVGEVVVRVSEAIERCRMVGVAQVGLPARPGMLKAIGDHHDLLAGVYASVLRPGTISVGDPVTVGDPMTVGGRP